MSAQRVTISDQDTGQLILTLDVSENETHAGEAEATDHPVEQGANMTDHIRPKPRTLSITGMVSNTPVQNVVAAAIQNGGTPQAAATVLQGFNLGTPGPAEDAFAKLEARRTSGRLHTVATKLTTYQNMALLYVSEPRDSKTGDVLAFTLNFKEILVVLNKTFTVQTAKPSGQGRQDKGRAVASSAATAAADASVADKLLFGGQ